MTAKLALRPRSPFSGVAVSLAAVALFATGCGAGGSPSGGSTTGAVQSGPSPTDPAPPGGGSQPGPEIPVDLLLTNDIDLVVDLGDGLPVVDATLRLEGGPRAITAHTGADGVARLSRVPTGDYRVEIAELPPHTEPTDLPGSVRVGPFRPRTIDLHTRVELQGGPMLLFGDSDSTPRIEADHTVEQVLAEDPAFVELVGRDIGIVNRSNGNTPAHDDGVEQVLAGLADHPEAAVALLRFGLNDVHQYLYSGGDGARQRFEDAYVEILEATLDRGVLPVLYTISIESREDRRAGDRLANQVLRELAERYRVPLVETDLDALEQRDLFDGDGTHLNDRGHAYIAARTLETLMDYFTHVR